MKNKIGFDIKRIWFLDLIWHETKCTMERVMKLILIEIKKKKIQKIQNELLDLEKDVLALENDLLVLEAKKK